MKNKAALVLKCSGAEMLSSKEEVNQKNRYGYEDRAANSMWRGKADQAHRRACNDIKRCGGIKHISPLPSENRPVTGDEMKEGKEDQYKIPACLAGEFYAENRHLIVWVF